MDLISISSPPSPSYYCYQCTRVVTVSCPTHVVCPHCDGGFIQSVDPSDHLPQPDPTHHHTHSDSPRIGFTQQNRTRRTNTNTNTTTIPITNTSSSSSFNPLVVLRSPPNESEDHRNYELYYNDGAGSGLRQLPPTMSESLLGSGFELMLDRLSQIGFNLWARPDNPPASKRAVASLPVITIGSGHVEGDFSHCAVCKDQFTLGSEAREMPCRHIYHSDCILPWLNLHSSCPVCREELPGDEDPDVVGSGSTRPEAVGLTIWRLPGGGFAVGRFVGGGGEGEMPGVFSEVDGSLNFSGRVGRGIEWEPWMRRRRGSGLRRLFGNLGSIFRRRNGSGGSSGSGVTRSRSISETSGSGNWMFGRSLTRRSRNRDSVGTMER